MLNHLTDKNEFAFFQNMTFSKAAIHFVNQSLPKCCYHHSKYQFLMQINCKCLFLNQKWLLKNVTFLQLQLIYLVDPHRVNFYLNIRKLWFSYN